MRSRPPSSRPRSPRPSAWQSRSSAGSRRRRRTSTTSRPRRPRSEAPHPQAGRPRWPRRRPRAVRPRRPSAQPARHREPAARRGRPRPNRAPPRPRPDAREERPMTVPVSGLAANDRALVRKRAVQAAVLSIDRAGGLHYTKGPRRWEGIDQHLSAARGQVPAYGDCSASATWWLWNGLWLLYGKPDTVNGQGWKYGFTGTMLTSGKAVP